MERLIAGAIDVVAVVVLGIVYASTFGSEQSKGPLSFSFNEKVVNDGVALVFGVVVLGLFMLSESTTGRTLGKAMVGLRVMGDNGNPPRTGQIALRTILRPVDGLPWIVPNLVGFVVLVSSAERKRLGDRAGHTVVIATRRSQTAQSVNDPASF